LKVFFSESLRPAMVGSFGFAPWAGA
jgi:hypothetical protein